MKNSTTFLLSKIVEYKTNGYDSFGQLHARHIEDISKLMNEFLKETILELMPLLNSGKSVTVFDDLVLQIKKTKKKSKHIT